MEFVVDVVVRVVGAGVVPVVVVMLRGTGPGRGEAVVVLTRDVVPTRVVGRVNTVPVGVGPGVGKHGTHGPEGVVDDVTVTGGSVVDVDDDDDDE